MAAKAEPDVGQDVLKAMEANPDERVQARATPVRHVEAARF